MAPRFIAKTMLDGLRPLRTDDAAALEQFDRLRDWLTSRAGPEAAELFAEPVVTWGAGGPAGGGSVSWYADAPGEAEPLSVLPAERRAAVENQLRRVLARLWPLRTDGSMGPLLLRALCVSDPAAILAVGGRAVVTGWGLADASRGEQPDPAAGALGPFLPADPVPAAAAGAAVPAPPRAAPPVGPPVGPPAPVVRSGPQSAWNWWLLPVGVALGAILLLAGFVLGARLVAQRAAARSTTVDVVDEAATRAAIERQKEANAALERQLEERRRQLAGNVCVADPAQMPRLGPDRAAIPPPAAVPPPPGGQPFAGTLAELLTQAVVLVLVPTGDGGGLGTGFFVTPELIVTNRHVVEKSEGRILVTSRKLGQVTEAQLVAQTPDSELGHPDLALLRVAGVSGIQPLALTREAQPLDQVIAAGFPGLLIRADAAFDRLRNGDTGAVPQVILTDGRINAIQDSGGGIRIMPHSAAVSGGNSGGPLVDACGRVVGVNTFITADREQVAHANYAQKADGVSDFLRQNGVGIADATGPCTPRPPATASAPPATPPPAAPSPTPAPTPASPPR